MVYNHQRLQHRSPGAGNKQWMQNVGLASQTSLREGVLRGVRGELGAVPKRDPSDSTHSCRTTLKTPACV